MKYLIWIIQMFILIDLGCYMNQDNIEHPEFQGYFLASILIFSLIMAISVYAVGKLYEPKGK